MSKHTELPWRSPGTMVRDAGPAFAPIAANTLIAKVYSTAYKDDAQALANAAFIVRACNSHYELLEALKAFTFEGFTLHEVEWRVDPGTFARIKVARAAISKAEANT